MDGGNPAPPKKHGKPLFVGICRGTNLANTSKLKKSKSPTGMVVLCDFFGLCVSDFRAVAET